MRYSRQVPLLVEYETDALDPLLPGPFELYALPGQACEEEYFEVYVTPVSLQTSLLA